MPNADNLRRISATLGVSVDWLLGFNVPIMRGASWQKADLETELAVHVEHALATHAQGKPYAFHLATEVVDGAELVKAAVNGPVQRVEEAWRQASSYTKSGIRLLTEGVASNASPKRRSYPVLAHLTFQAAIFNEALHRGSKIFLRSTRSSERRTNRPLMVLLRGVGAPIDVRKKSSGKPRE